MGFREDFFEKLEASLEKHTQAELAAMVGVAQSQVSKVFGKNRKTQNPGLKFVAAILDDQNMAIYPRGSVGQDAASEMARLQEELKRQRAEIDEITKEKYRLEGQVDILRDMLKEAKNDAKTSEEGEITTFLKKTS